MSSAAYGYATQSVAELHASAGAVTAARPLVSRSLGSPSSRDGLTGEAARADACKTADARVYETALYKKINFRFIVKFYFVCSLNAANNNQFKLLIFQRRHVGRMLGFISWIGPQVSASRAVRSTPARVARPA